MYFWILIEKTNFFVEERRSLSRQSCYVQDSKQKRTGTPPSTPPQPQQQNHTYHNVPSTSNTIPFSFGAPEPSPPLCGSSGANRFGALLGVWLIARFRRRSRLLIDFLERLEEGLPGIMWTKVLGCGLEWWPVGLIEWWRERIG